jgi:hypothetical protein
MQWGILAVVVRGRAVQVECKAPHRMNILYECLIFELSEYRVRCLLRAEVRRSTGQVVAGNIVFEGFVLRERTNLAARRVSANNAVTNAPN